ncbi:hypothetical protein C8F04DRAFT_96772 [Mycena alexandri]|uniref:Uncharacterized protein n=1 Tax=Mycena alexandri TaxID=1745969 RepID=A0AAD6T9V5_9AGAR|nr:hypothetical protein C8F04DRAFT_96772 [Mycena alexandri]
MILTISFVLATPLVRGKGLFFRRERRWRGDTGGAGAFHRVVCVCAHRFCFFFALLRRRTSGETARRGRLGREGPVGAGGRGRPGRSLARLGLDVLGRVDDGATFGFFSRCVPEGGEDSEAASGQVVVRLRGKCAAHFHANASTLMCRLLRRTPRFEAEELGLTLLAGT